MMDQHELVEISNDFKTKVTLINNSQNIQQITIDTIASVLTLFSKFFPELKNRELTVVFDSQQSNPRCIHLANIIFLTCDCLKPNQLAYQLSHELCHFCINNLNYDTNMLWFEESLCEMASYYFLKEMTFYWKEKFPNCISSDNDKYYPLFQKYAIDDMKKAIPFDIANLKESNDTLSILEENGTNREYNAYVAIKLLPIFESYPGLWKTITCFKDIHKLNLEDFLLEWYSLTPKYLQKKAMKQVLKLFNVDVHQQIQEFPVPL
ncbi:MAG: hypothetical protein KHY19_02595 [Coprobacillus cateniformis]|nr:hypothetical protein [Coprobacillus cateniformis]